MLVAPSINFHTVSSASSTMGTPYELCPFGAAGRDADGSDAAAGGQETRTLATQSAGSPTAYPDAFQNVRPQGTCPHRRAGARDPSLNPLDFTAAFNVCLESFVPHAAVLRHVAAVVTQCD